MIKENNSLSIVEALEYADSKNESEAKIKKFMVNFKKLDIKEAKNLREKIKGMELLKVRDTHISKIIDLVPENKEDLNKIFTEVGLDEDESKQILNAIEEFR